MSNSVEDDTTVNESYSVTVPASVRKEAGLESVDKLRWRVDEKGELHVEVVKHRRGAFSDLEPVELDEETNAVDDHDAIAGEY